MTDLKFNSTSEFNKTRIFISFLRNKKYIWPRIV